MSKQVEVDEKYDLIKIKNVPALLLGVRNFWQKSNTYCNIDVTIDTSPLKQSLIKSGATQVRMMIESREKCFPHRM